MMEQEHRARRTPTLGGVTKQHDAFRVGMFNTSSGLKRSIPLCILNNVAFYSLASLSCVCVVHVCMCSNACGHMGVGYVCTSIHDCE